MAENVHHLTVKTVLDSSKIVQVPYTPPETTAEDICITLCKQLSIGTVARHIFSLRDPLKNIYFPPGHIFDLKAPTIELRIRFKPADIIRLRGIDAKAYDYYFHQARNDVLDNKISDLPFEKYRRELVGLGVTDMYRVMLEKDIPRETVESDYKKYIPKEVLKRHAFFIKKPIHDTLGKIRKAGHDAWYVKEQYLKQLDMMTPDYPCEEYKAQMDQNGSVCNIHVRVAPHHPTEPGIKYCFESKRENWMQICSVEELGFISIRKDSTVELSRPNGIPFYLKFISLPTMYSFVSLLDGYYRLSCKWTFNICKEVATPSLQRLYSIKCHGPVGGEFSYAKLEEKRSNRPGTFILRESESKYNVYFMDVCMKNCLKPKTYKLEKLSGDEYIFNDDLTRYKNLMQLMLSYNDSNGPIYLAECLPPSEYDLSPLLLCKHMSLSGDMLSDGNEESGIPKTPICINTRDLQVYKGCGIEILISNKESALTYGNKDAPELEPSHGVLKASEYTYFDISWDHGFLTLALQNSTKPIFLQEFKLKDNLIGARANSFKFYSARGDNVLWSFPFCDEEHECDVHTTTSSNRQLYQPLHEKDVGHDLVFHVRACHDAVIHLVPSPVLDYPFLKIALGVNNDMVNIVYSEYESAGTVTLAEKKLPSLINYWRWSSFTVSFFSDSLQLFWNRDMGTFMIIDVKHEMIKSLRWFVPSSLNSVAHWSFYCTPPKSASAKEAFLPECALNEKEFNYIGTQDITNTGLPCLPWSGKKLLPGTLATDFKTDQKGLVKMRNYCRSANIEESTFCYAMTEDKTRVVKEQCKIRKCKSAECRMAGTGNDFIGKVNVTRSNRTCQFWTANVTVNKIPANNKVKVGAKIGAEDLKSLAAMKATTEKLSAIEEKEEYCGVWDKRNSRCLSKVKVKRSTLSREDTTKMKNAQSLGYKLKSHIFDSIAISKKDATIGNVSQTVEEYLSEKSETEETIYIKVHEVEPRFLNGTLYADTMAEKAENFCRNPSRSLAGAWCYTMDEKVPIDLCNVPDCDRHEQCTIFIQGNVEGQKKESSEGITVVYKCMWRHVKGKKIEVAMKLLNAENRDKYLKEFLDLSGQWAFLQSSVVVRMFGVTLTSQLSMVLEYVRLGPLDQYLRDHRADIKVVDLLEASSNLASALWHLAENGIVHGNIRCRKLLVSSHDENSFTVKLADPGMHNSYASKEVHWIPIECYSNLDFARRTTAADVWAFATTLWEIFMYGEPIKHTDHLEAMRFYASGKRLLQPHMCPADIYRLMFECWDADPHRRKLPQAIMRDINQMLYQVFNSRKQHAYSKIKNYDTRSIESIYSNQTESTNVTSQEELVSVFDMTDEDNDFSSKSSLWSVNTLAKTFKDVENSEDSFPCDLSNLLSSVNFSTATTSLDSINSIQTIFELDDDCNVILQGRIGQGFYGEVYKGTLERDGQEPRLVAVKKLKPNAVYSCVQDFEREISIMKTLQHPNIVEILGVLQDPEVSLVMEFVLHGSLQSYLKIYKESLQLPQLLNYALDIANGMEYLGRKNIVHRDLAARNILVVDENRVKISDFGLARVIDSNNYYILQTNRDLPIKWYALESLRDGKFSMKSDVWSYGVTMWEMFSYGEEPNLPTEVEKIEVPVLVEILEKGIRFPCPVNCPQSVYVRLIYPCWMPDTHIRPTFVHLRNEVKELLLQH